MMAKSKKAPAKKPDPRINLSFYGDNLKFVQYAAWRNRKSITAYINQLIEREKPNYDRAEWDQPDPSPED